MNHDTGLYNKLLHAMLRYDQHLKRSGIGRQLNNLGAIPFSWSSVAYKASGTHDSPTLPPLTTEEAVAYDPETVLVGSKLSLGC